MEVFFYGLFMDQQILAKKGVKPTNPRKAYLKDYDLKIGNRASLIPSPGTVCYGILMSCEANALQQLYSEASVADYLPEAVTVFTDPEVSIKAYCYNLPPELISGMNTKYARALYQLAKRLEFPEEYLVKILEMNST